MRASEDAAVADIIVEALLRRGVDARWSGEVKDRIEIAPFAWQKRLYAVRRPTPLPLPPSAKESETFARAQRIVGSLLDAGLLELTKPALRATLEQDLADVLGDGDEEGDILLEWLVSQRCVSEVFADEEELSRIVSAARTEGVSNGD